MRIKAIPPLVKPTITYSALVGQVVLRHRKSARMDQAALASALQVTQSTYSRLEQGQSSMTLAQLRVIASCLGLAPGEVLRKADALADRLRTEGVEISDEKKIPTAAVLVGLGILAALLASKK